MADVGQEPESSLFQPLARSTARVHPEYFHSRSCSSIVGLNTLTSNRFTLASVSGLVKSQLKRPRAPPARIAAPRTVDLFTKKTRTQGCQEKEIPLGRIEHLPRRTHSRISGRRTSIPRMSAWICIVTSLPVIPPSTCNTFNPAGPWFNGLSSSSRGEEVATSFDMASRIARVWKHVASSVARTMWCLVVNVDRPIIMPLVNSEVDSSALPSPIKPYKKKKRNRATHVARISQYGAKRPPKPCACETFSSPPRSQIYVGAHRTVTK